MRAKGGIALKEIHSAREYFDRKFEKLAKGACLVVVLDPDGFLKLEDEYIDPTGRSWLVLEYYENDLAFRRIYNRLDPDIAKLIRITYPQYKKMEKINLSYILDVVERADDVIDLSLTSILKELTPKETWPIEIKKFSSEIGSNFDRFIGLYRELRKELPQGAPLNLNLVKALVLATRNQSLAIRDLLFRELDPIAVLTRYLRTVWQSKLNDEDLNLLREIVKTGCLIDISSIVPWIEENAASLATFLYLLGIFKRYGVANPIIQLKGLGILDFDPEKLRKEQVEKILEMIESDSTLKLKIPEIAEEKIASKDVKRIIDCIGVESKVEIANNILKEISPLMILALAESYLRLIGEEKELSIDDLHWAKNLRHELLAGKLHTQYSSKAIELLYLFQELAFIVDILLKPIEVTRDLARLIDWYKESGAYALEIELARLKNRFQKIEKEYRKLWKEKIEKLEEKIRRYLEQADLHLANVIESNFPAYISSPRLNINILREMIITKNIRPSETRKLWILIFDGMRLDTWEKIVKPILASKFEIIEERLYLCALPSITDIARVSILAGDIPSQWQDITGRPTSDHNILAARLFSLTQRDAEEKLQIISAAETDIGQKRLEEKPYNVLIYNLSDDWIHTFRDELWELNETIKGKIERGILADIEARISENDYIVLTSDHGFIELDQKDEIRVHWKTDPLKLREGKNPVNFRFLENIEHRNGVKIQYRKGEFYTVAKGRKWFGRERGKFQRYTHGGITFAETVVPGVVLKKMIIPVIELELELPKIIEVIEDKEIEVIIGIKNNGNKEGEFNLIINVNTGEKQEFKDKVKPKHMERISFQFKPTLKTKSAEVELTYLEASGRLRKEERIIPVKVIPRKDKVELDLTALDKFDNI